MADPDPIRELLADETVALVERWLTDAASSETSADRRSSGRLQRLIDDPAGVDFTMRFVDRVARPDDLAAAANQLHQLVAGATLPSFLGVTDRLMLRVGAVVGRLLPGIVIPLARRRMRGLVGHLVVDADPAPLQAHLSDRRADGFAQNVNLLGEAVLGEMEADRRLNATIDLLDQPEVNYVSVKLSSVASQLNYWDWEGSVDRVSERLRQIFSRASSTSTFVNLDMEEYHDLELTVATFTRVLSEPEFHGLDAGIVLQAYLPDSFSELEHLVAWANQRRGDGGGEIKIRLVKGANLAMERVDAVIHGWEQAPYRSKHEVDANYKRCLDYLLDPGRMAGVRLGVASHNLFDIAWARLLSAERGVGDRVEFEMLQGMAPAQARTVKADADGLLLYTPIVAAADFDVAISYLFRRLEENSAPGNFMRVVAGLLPGTSAFGDEESRFRSSLADRWTVGREAQRSQQRPARGAAATTSFTNEPDTDPALSSNRGWARNVLLAEMQPSATPVLTEAADVLDQVARAKTSTWSSVAPSQRRQILHRVADRLAARRGDLINAMIHEGRKTFAQADPEVSEAIDFARYYGDRALDLQDGEHARFDPLGVIAVIPPWNFPVAIPAGGVMSALAAGNAVIFKPSSQTPRCAEIVAECAWEAGVPPDALQFMRTKGHDVGKALVTSVDGVILTGSAETAAMFQGWRDDLRLFAETSGKNAMVITPHADIDLAVADLVASAFGHAGQKCSAASLAICVGSVYESERFRRQLVDAVESLVIGPTDDIATNVGPTIYPVEGKLERGLTRLDAGESWLVEPMKLDATGALWRPGVRIGVKPGTWFHQTECFGPVLGVMQAASLDEAITTQNATEYGLTGGIHSLDPGEIATWLERVEVGNAYVNRVTTGAIVQRQPFGGWKRSNVGPGAKAGGPNYVNQLGTWTPTSRLDLTTAARDDAHWWAAEFGREHDPSGLFCEANILRYRPLPHVVIRVADDAPEGAVERVLAAASVCGVPTSVADQPEDQFIERLDSLGVERIRVVGTPSPELRRAAQEAHIHLADAPVTNSGRLELLHYLREQSVSRTLHRFGNLVAVD